MGISLQDAQRNPRLAAAISAEYGKVISAPKRHIKSNAQRSESTYWELAGRSFPSKLERAVAELLVLQLRAGTIRDLIFQKTVLLAPTKIRWKCDFEYTETATGITWLHEAKGFEDRRWKMIHQILADCRPYDVRISRGRVKDGMALVKTEEIRKK